MQQRAKFERRLRAAKSEHDESKHFVKNSHRRVREAMHREHTRALRHISKAIVANETEAYELSAEWLEWFDYDDYYDWMLSERPARRWSA